MMGLIVDIVGDASHSYQAAYPTRIRPRIRYLIHQLHKRTEPRNGDLLGNGFVDGLGRSTLGDLKLNLSNKRKGYFKLKGTSDSSNFRGQLL